MKADRGVNERRGIHGKVIEKKPSIIFPTISPSITFKSLRPSRKKIQDTIIMPSNVSRLFVTKTVCSIPFRSLVYQISSTMIKYEGFQSVKYDISDYSNFYG